MERVVVFGSFVVDLMARGEHLPVPGETVKGSMFQMGPGGKGFNQAIAAKRAGAQISLVTKIGRDSFAEVALSMLRGENMPPDFVFVSEDAPTGAAVIMVDERTSQNQIMVTLGACDTFDDADIEKIKPLIQTSKYLLIQLETNVDGVEKMIRIAKENNVFVILNPAPIQPFDSSILKMVDVITPNEVEASILTGIPVNSPEDAKKAAENLFDRGVKNVVITLGSKGVFAATMNETRHFQNLKVNAVDTTGAGDAFNGALLTALAEGEDLFSACSFARAAANLSVTKIGTSVAMPYREEIEKLLKENQK